MVAKQTNTSGLDDIESNGLVQKLNEAETKLNTALGANSQFEKSFKDYRMKMDDRSDQRNLENAAKGLAASRQDFADLRTLMADLNINLIQYSQEFNMSADQFGEYEGFKEKLFGNILGKGESKLALWAKAKAKNSMQTRMEKNSLEKSAIAMMKHGEKVSEVLKGGIDTLTECYTTVSGDRKKSAQEYKMCGAKITEWGDQALKYKEQLTEIEEKYKAAEGDDKAQLMVKRSELEGLYADAQSKADQFTVKRDQAQEADKILAENLASYEQIINNMKNIRVVVMSQVAHYSNMLPRLQKLAEVVNKIEGASMYSQQTKQTVNVATKLTGKMAKRVAAESEKIITVETLTQDELAAVKQDIKDAIATYNASLETLDARDKRNLETAVSQPYTP
jgi:hypothetical protein